MVVVVVVVAAARAVAVAAARFIPSGLGCIGPCSGVL